eukprot:7453687-Alexandrium_andersonii.AAC.1
MEVAKQIVYHAHPSQLYGSWPVIPVASVDLQPRERVLSHGPSAESHSAAAASPGAHEAQSSAQVSASSASANVAAMPEVEPE